MDIITIINLAYHLNSQRVPRQLNSNYLYDKSIIIGYKLYHKRVLNY